LSISEPYRDDEIEAKDDEIEAKPKLELEPVYGGPGGRGKTAVGAGAHSDGPEPRRFSPTEAPKWFDWIFPMTRPFIKLQLQPLTPKRRRELCDAAKLSEDELTVLRMRWRMNLNLEWTASGDSIRRFARTESSIEKQAAWKLWLYRLYLFGF